MYRKIWPEKMNLCTLAKEVGMMNRQFWCIIAPVILIFLLIMFEASYQSVNGYFPWISRWDYLMLGDKLRIVND